MSALIYIIGANTNPVKVGWTTNMAERLSELQVGCPDELIVHHVFRTPKALAPGVEKHVHSILWPHWRRGEWFNIGAEAAYEVILREGTRYIAFVEAMAGPWRQTAERWGCTEWGPLNTAKAVGLYSIETGADAEHVRAVVRAAAGDDGPELLDGFLRGRLPSGLGAEVLHDAVQSVARHYAGRHFSLRSPAT